MENSSQIILDTKLVGEIEGKRYKKDKKSGNHFVIHMEENGYTDE